MMQNVELFIEDIREQMQASSAEQLETTFAAIETCLAEFQAPGVIGRLELTQCFAIFIIGINIRHKLVKISQKRAPHVETLSKRFGAIMLDCARAAMSSDQSDVDDIYSILYKIQTQLRSKELINKKGRFKNNLYMTGTYVYSDRKLLETIGLLGSRSSFLSYIEAPEYKQYEAYIVAFFRIFETNDLARIGTVLHILLKIRTREFPELMELLGKFDFTVNLENKYFSSRIFFKRVDEFKQRFVSKINVQVDKRLRDFHDHSLNEKNNILKGLATLQTLERFLPDGETLGFIAARVKKVRAVEVEPVEAMISNVLNRLKEEKSGTYFQHWHHYMSFYEAHCRCIDIFSNFYYKTELCRLDRPSAIAELGEKKRTVVKLSGKPDYKTSFVYCEEILIGLLTELQTVFTTGEDRCATT